MQESNAPRATGKDSTRGKTARPTKQVIAHVAQRKLAGALRNYFMFESRHEYIFCICWLVSDWLRSHEPDTTDRGSQAVRRESAIPDMSAAMDIIPKLLDTIVLISELDDIAVWRDMDPFEKDVKEDQQKK